MSAAPADLLLGTLIDGRYRVERAIASGGFGTVYSAFHVGLRSPVALKVLKLPDQLRPDQLAKLCGAFFDEARTLKRLHHPSIVSALDVGLLPAGEGGVQLPYLVMEWCDGPTLEQHLRARGGPLLLGDAWGLFEPLLDAVAYAHAQGVAHRDLKPSNVLLEVGQGDGRILPRLIDFGIAKIVVPGEAAGTGKTQTVSGSSPFTPRYAAPEQLAGARTGPWTDVHALALLFVELVAGRPAIGKDGDPIAALLNPVRPTPKVSGVDVGGLEPVLQRALAIRPADRYPDAAALAHAMRAVAASPSRGARDARDAVSAASSAPAPQRIPESPFAAVDQTASPSSSTLGTMSARRGATGAKERILGARFRIESRAGAGGSSVVYRATDTLHGGSVALKVPHDPDAFDRFRFDREVEVLSGASDGRIVRYIAHGTDPEAGPWLAMEWLDGETLSSRLSRDGLPLHDAIRLATALAETLGALHQRGIIHRDIKPSNLFLVGGDLRKLKLLDFGIARSTAHAAITKTGALIGTVGYMSPEQIRGETSIDQRSDLFSLGCLLFQCVTGRLPFDGDQPIDWLLKIALEEAPRADSITSNVPLGLSLVLAKMLRKQPSERYANMAEVAGALRSLQAEEGEIPKSVRSVPAPAITGTERRFVSLLLCRDPAASGGDDVIADEVRRHGGVLHESPDGLVLVTLGAVAVPTDLACSAAKLGQAFAKAWPSARVVVLSIWLTRGSGGFNPAIDIATALFALGEPGTVIVDEATHSLLQGSIASSPLEATRATTRPASGTRAHVLAAERPTARRDTSRFVGRERELGTLVDAFEHAFVEGSAEVVLALGPAGIGKSRLAHEARARICARWPGVTALFGSVEGGERTGSLGLIRSMVRRFLSIPEGRVEPERMRPLLAFELAGVVDPAALDLEIDFLVELLFSSSSTSPSPAVRAARAEPRLMSDQLTRAVDLWLHGLLRRGPLLLHVESLHWADEASLALLDRFLGTVAQRPVLVIGTGRPDTIDRFPAIFSERSVTTMKLRELTTRAAEQLARDLLPSAEEALVHRVVELGGGNPLLLEELARAAREGHDRELPDSVLALSQSRLDRLSERERRFLRAASVFGDRFLLGGVGALLAADEAETLEALCRRDVVRRVDDATAGTATHSFQSPIVREVAYASIPESEIARAHLRAADFLESNGETRALDLAFHLDRAQVPTRAAAWYLRAARQSLEAMDLPSAARWGDKALDADHRPNARGAALCLRAQIEEARWAWAEVKKYGLEAMSLLPEGGVLWFMTAHALMPSHARTGDIASFTRLAERLRRTAPAPEAVNAAVLALAASANMLALGGHLDTAREALACVDAFEPLLPAGASGTAYALMARGGIAMTSGDLGSYRALRLAAADRFELSHDWRRATEVRGTSGYADCLLGRYDEALATLSLCVARAVEYRMTSVHYLRHNVGFVLLELGRYAEARTTLEATLAPLHAHDPRLERGSLQYLARALVALGELDLGERHARTAMAGAERPAAKMSARGDLAHVLLAQGRAAEALTLAEEAASPLLADGPFDECEMFVRVALVRARAATGDVAGARAAAREARQRLGVLAARITGPAYQKSFVENVAEHVALRRVAEQLG